MATQPRHLKFREICPDGNPVHAADRRPYGCTRTVAHDHDFHEIILIRKGVVRQVVNDSVVDLKTGVICLIAPSDVHYFEEVAAYPDAWFTNVACTKELYEQAAGRLARQPARFGGRGPVVLSPASRPLFSFVVSLVDPLKNFHAQPHALREQAAGTALLAILNEAAMNCPQGDGDAENMPRWLRAALRAMEEERNYVEGLPRLIALSGKSQEHLARTMRACLGCTPTDFVNRKRIERAAMILASSEQPVSRIMFETGFNNASHFNELFREKYGCSPRQYRARHEMVVNPKKRDAM